MNQKLFENYKLKLQNFEGPFDLLFHLIEKSEMDLYDIKISEITEQYLEFLFDMQKMDLEIASEFLVMASTLLHIKSKMLLPVIVEDEEEIDPRERLIIQLLEYKQYKNASLELKKQHDKGKLLFYGQLSNEDFGKEQKVYDVSAIILRDMCNNILKRNERKKNYKNRYMQKILRHDKYTVEKEIRNVVKILFNNKVISFFNHFKKKKYEKLETVVSFLSILELAKEKKAKLTQKSIFLDIYIEKTDKLNEDDYNEFLDIYQ